MAKITYEPGDNACVCGFVGCPGLPMAEARKMFRTTQARKRTLRVLKEKPRYKCRRVRAEVLRRRA